MERLIQKIKGYLHKNKWGYFLYFFLAIILIILILLVIFNVFKKNPESLTATPVDPEIELEDNTYINIDVFSDEKTIISPFEMPAIKQPIFSNNSCSISDYGAISDGKTLSTQAFAAAISDCSKKGGGTVMVPPGQWFTGAIKLEDNINLHLVKDANIIFSSNPDDYLPAVPSRYEGIDYVGYSPFIYGNNCKNIAITGNGTLDGQGQLWWKKNKMATTYSLYDMAKNDIAPKNRIFASTDNLLRPSFVQFNNCKSVLLEDFKIKNSPMWTIQPLYSSDIIIRNININTLGLNTDGIAVDSSKNVLIEGVNIISGDDAIAIKSGRDKDGLRANKPSENIVIRNCNMTQGHAGIAAGSETSGGIKNIFAYNNTMKLVNFGIRFKSTIGRGGTVQNFWVQNTKVHHIKQEAILITTDYNTPYSPEYTAVPEFKNIFIDNFISGKVSGMALEIKGHLEKPVENIELKNISISSKNGIEISHTKNVSLDKFNVSGYGADSLFNISDSENIVIDSSKCQPRILHCINVRDQGTSGIFLKNSPSFAKKIIFGEGVSKDSVIIE